MLKTADSHLRKSKKIKFVKINLEYIHVSGLSLVPLVQDMNASCNSIPLKRKQDWITIFTTWNNWCQSTVSHHMTYVCLWNEHFRFAFSRSTHKSFPKVTQTKWEAFLREKSMSNVYLSTFTISFFSKISKVRKERSWLIYSSEVKNWILLDLQYLQVDQPLNTLHYNN